MYKYIVFALLILISCSSLKTIKKGKQNGTMKEYSLTYDKAWKLSKSILQDYSSDKHGRTSIVYDKENNYMATPVFNGFIGVWIDKINEEKVIITAYSRRELVTYITMGLSESKFHELLQEKIRNE